MYTLLKSDVGPWPEPTFPPGIDLKQEARRSRRRMYVVSAVYPAYLLALVARAYRESLLGRALAFCLVGLALWTLTEYLVHRFVLHVAFPGRKGRLSRVLHRLFDASHVDHHAKPWDGYHINGHLDTLFVAVWLAPLSLLAPRYSASMVVAGLFVGYTAEEWMHHALHFHNPHWRPFQYVRRRHLYHHSRHGVGTAYGVTSGFWDGVFGTRIPAPQRERLLPLRTARRAAADA
jgi:4-hydroxysphinganine ceramide fatty acyl 2-hydroxylase